MGLRLVLVKDLGWVPSINNATFVLICVYQEKREKDLSFPEAKTKQIASCVSLGEIGLGLSILEAYGIITDGQTLHVGWNGCYEVNHNVYSIGSKVWMYVFLQDLQVIQYTTKFENCYASQFKTKIEGKKLRFKTVFPVEQA